MATAQRRGDATSTTATTRIAFGMALASVVLLTLITTVTAQAGSGVPTPDIRVLEVRSDVRFRYARTEIHSLVANPASEAQEVVFRAVLPDSAFVSSLVITVNGQEYRAHVASREEAKREYQAAVQAGRTAAHVAVEGARDASQISVALNVEARGKAHFNLTYEELLRRDRGLCRLKVMLDPGQVVKRLLVEVRIRDSNNITRVRVPRLRAVDNEVGDDDQEPLAEVTRPAPTEVLVRWAPDEAAQRQLVGAGPGGVRGLLEVQFDVDRGGPGNGSELLVGDGGYFVHFFAPDDLPPLTKHAVFVLDTSGSMFGRKIQQVQEAMSAILSELSPSDTFSLVFFSSQVHVWAGGADLRLVREESPLPPAAVVRATRDRVREAQRLVNATSAVGATHMFDALQTALRLVRLGRQVEVEEEANATVSDGADDNNANATLVSASASTPRQPLVVFLTDGEPNGPRSDPSLILSETTSANHASPGGAAPLYSLAFGTGADFSFLKKLSLRNAGFAKRIYEAADAALQLRNFYRRVASPLLSNVTFSYVNEEVDAATLTATTFPVHMAGSELAVAGRLQQALISNEPPPASPLFLRGVVRARGAAPGQRHGHSFPLDAHEDDDDDDDGVEIGSGPALRLPPEHGSFVERLWAFLTVRQLLDRADRGDDANSRTRAQELALRYAFVTPVTSLVVAKPGNASSVADLRDASLSHGAEPARHPGSAGGAGTMLATMTARRFSARGHMPSRGSASSLYFQKDSRDAATLMQPRKYSGPRRARMRGRVYSNAENNASNDTSTARASRPELIGLSDITWLLTSGNGSHVFLPDSTGLRAYAVSDQENNTEHDECTVSSGGNGTSSGGRRRHHCRHLRHCALQVFASNATEFMPYFCSIGEYVGACCPDNLFNADGTRRQRNHRRRAAGSGGRRRSGAGTDLDAGPERQSLSSA